MKPITRNGNGPLLFVKPTVELTGIPLGFANDFFA
jgi:hypothetical protein